jgi:hypothetical protein
MAVRKRAPWSASVRSGQLGRNRCPTVPTLDQESPGSSPGGATQSATSEYLRWRFAYLEGVCESVSELMGEFIPPHLATQPRGQGRWWAWSLKRYDRPHGVVIGLLVALLQCPYIEISSHPPAAATSFGGRCFRSVAQTLRNMCHRLPPGFWSLPRRNASFSHHAARCRVTGWSGRRRAAAHRSRCRHSHSGSGMKAWVTEIRRLK